MEFQNFSSSQTQTHSHCLPLPPSTPVASISVSTNSPHPKSLEHISSFQGSSTLWCVSEFSSALKAERYSVVCRFHIWVLHLSVSFGVQIPAFQSPMSWFFYHPVHCLPPLSRFESPHALVAACAFQRPQASPSDLVSSSVLAWSWGTTLDFPRAQPPIFELKLITSPCVGLL